MTLIHSLNLEEVRIVEKVLSRDKVEEYKTYGINRILEQLNERQREGEPHFAGWYELDGLEFVQLIDFCHRCRALHDLDQRKVDLIVPIDTLEVIAMAGEIPLSLKDAPFLNLTKYSKWHEKYYGWPIKVKRI
ncbi:hypothetical protein HYS31_04385 [Candidatus Woesearchaeota archaeon]|nr:hypothetical protein [Candidatus Woesearchaeota archaeon]